MKNIYADKNTTCFIFTAKKENEEYERISYENDVFHFEY